MIMESLKSLKDVEKANRFSITFFQEFEGVLDQYISSFESSRNQIRIDENILIESINGEVNSNYSEVNVAELTTNKSIKQFDVQKESPKIVHQIYKYCELDVDCFIDGLHESSFNAVSIKEINEFCKNKHNSIEKGKIVRWNKLNLLKSKNTSNEEFQKLSDSFEPIFVIKCTFCGKEFANGSALGGHTSKMHSKEQTMSKKRKRIHKLRTS